MIWHRPGEIEWDEAAVAAARALHGFGNEHLEQPHFIYRVFDASGVLLYLGVTCNPWQRFGEHRRSAAWWPRAERAEWEFAGTMLAAFDAERVAIWSEAPEFNKKGKPRLEKVAS